MIQTGSTVLQNGHTVDQYLALYQEYFDEANYDACFRICDTILKYNPDEANAYVARAAVYAAEHKWDNVIADARQAIKINPDQKKAHEVLFDAYLAANKPKEAVAEVSVIQKMDPNDASVYGNQNWAKGRYALERVSNISVSLLILFWVILFFLLYVKKNDQLSIASGERGTGNLLLIFIPATLTFILYLLFYHFSAFIWSGNSHYPAQDYIPFMIRDFTFENDGREVYVLYILFLAVVFFSLLGFGLIKKIKNDCAYKSLLFVLGLCTAIFLIKIGFYPPCSDFDDHWIKFILLSSLFTAIIWASNLLALRYPRVSFIVIVMILLPVCFLAHGSISVYDYGYILSPALRLYYGEHIPDIYFQYDLYMSLMALAFLKLGINIYKFQFVAQAGYYIFFIFLYMFARSFFYNKKLPFLLLVFVVIFRYYGNMDPVGYFQITPWRLDLWLVLLILVYWRGAYHWTVGLFLGFLLVLHRNFGFIYLGAYLELLFVLMIADLINATSYKAVFVCIKQSALRSMPNIILVVISFAVSYKVLGGIAPASALAYQKIGIGMVRISTISFYWYVAILLGIITILLSRYHKRLSERYYVASVFLILLTIGNSMYFFGRSHEHNIINLGGTLSICLFLFIDLLGFGVGTDMPLSMNRRIEKYAYTMLPLLVVWGAYFFYDNGVSVKVRKQYLDIKEQKFMFPIDLGYDFDRLKRITDSSERVFFLEFYMDFFYYYEGHYKPVGYFNPNDSWVLKKDMVAMLQNKLDSGYYIVIMRQRYNDEILAMLDYNGHRVDDKYCVYYKRPYTSALQLNNKLLYRSFIDPVPAEGIENPISKISSSYTAECVFREDTVRQANGAILFSDLHTTLGFQGLQLNLTDSTGERLTFSYGNGTELISLPPFPINKYRVNYIAITAGKNLLTIYLNGKKMSESLYTKNIIYSDRPFMIGNGKKQSKAFKGYIYEVAVSEVVKSKELIEETAKRISLNLN